MEGGRAAAVLPAVFLALLHAAPAHAESDEAALAEKLNDPVAPLINVPIDLTFDEKYGRGEGDRYTLKAKPVIPIPLNDEWRVISRTILPLTYQDGVTGNGGDKFGLGDISQSFFFVPHNDSGIIFGAGPVLLTPTATDEALGGGKWGAGPTAVIVKKGGGWTLGMLASQTWSFAGSGSSDRDDVNSLLVQPFVAYTTPQAWTYNLQSESTYDWDEGQAAIPLNFTISKLVKIGLQPVSFSGGVGYWLEHPDNGPKGWRFKLGATFAFPE
ncbi:MAG: transporter [Alphaproteobacteria bacterium]